VLAPFGKALAEEESGQLPQIEAEKRQQQYKLTDEERERKANDLESQLEMGRKYGTLTTEQQKQYVDQITGLYSKPEQQGSLLQRIHKALHPTGTVRQAVQPLPSAVPTGGTAAADEAQKLKTQAAEAEQQSQQSQQQQKQTQDSWAFFSKFIPDEDKPKAQSEWAMKNLGIAQSLKNIPGAAGQPVKGQDGRYYRPMQQPDGSIVQEPMPPDWTPAPKQAPPKVGTVNGKPAWGTLTPNGWVDPETQQPIPNFIPPPNYAQVSIPLAMARAKANAEYSVTPVTSDDGSDVLQTRANVVNAAKSGNPMTAGVVGAPSGLDKKNQMLALSAIQQVNRMEQILKDDPNLTGPGSGQLTQLQTWLGTQDPDAQQFILSGLLGSEHSVAVFGGRNIHTINDLNNVLANMKTNPEALRGALELIRETMTPWLTAGGRLPVTGAKQVGPILSKAGAKPNGATMTAPGSDGKMYWSDGKRNLGVVQ
jgi:hypothetical protein